MRPHMQTHPFVYIANGAWHHAYADIWDLCCAYVPSEAMSAERGCEASTVSTLGALSPLALCLVAGITFVSYRLLQLICKAHSFLDKQLFCAALGAEITSFALKVEAQSVVQHDSASQQTCLVCKRAQGWSRLSGAHTSCKVEKHFSKSFKSALAVCRNTNLLRVLEWCIQVCCICTDCSTNTKGSLWP